ncbi:MAG: LptE family protein [Pseudomonadota bacterium]
MCQCAYQWGHGGREIPGGYKTVHVKMFNNRSNEVGAETGFTQAFLQELERSGFITVTAEHSAEIIIQGTVVSITTQGGGIKQQFFDESGSIYNAPYFTTYNVIIATNLRAIRASDEKIVWQTNIRRKRDFRGGLLTKQGIRSSNVLYNHSRKKETIKLIAQDMMREAFDRLTENF